MAFRIRTRVAARTWMAARTQMVAKPATIRPLIKRPENCKYKTLLAVDGGAIRGIIPTVVLRNLETSIKTHILDNKEKLIPSEHRDVYSIHDFDVDLTDYFDLVAGTSVGSWITLYIAARGKGSDAITNDLSLESKYKDHNLKLRPGSMDGLLAMFLEYGEKAFPDPGRLARWNPLYYIRRLFWPLIPDKQVQEVLKMMFGETKLTDLETSCLMTSFDLKKNSASSFLHNAEINKTYTVNMFGFSKTQSSTDIEEQKGEEPRGQYDATQFEFRVRDVARASSAAPLYFSPAKITPLNSNSEIVLVDGLVVANNPSMQALTCAPHIYSDSEEISNFAMLSLGTGRTAPPKDISLSPGVFWWLSSGYMLDIFSYGASEMWESMMDFWLSRYLGLPKGQYVRVQFRDSDVENQQKLKGYLASEGHIKKLLEAGEETAYTYKDDIDTFVKNFMFARKNE